MIRLSFLFAAGFGIVVGVGCRERIAPDLAVPSASAPTAAASSSAPPTSSEGASKISEAEARRLVSATALAQRELARHPEYGVIVDARLTPTSPYVVTLQPKDREQWMVYPRFRVDATTGKLEAPTSCADKDEAWVDLDRADFESRASDAIFALPEIREYRRRLLDASSGGVWIMSRLEACEDATATAPASFIYYVGERHPDHIVRGFYFRVDRATLEFAIADADPTTFLPYAKWRTTARGRELAWHGVPPETATGAFGYGEPTNTLEGARIAHRAKTAADGLLRVERLEIYPGGYPVFIGERTNAADPSEEELRVLEKANGYRPFEIAWDGGKRRVRFDGDFLASKSGDAWKQH